MPEMIKSDRLAESSKFKISKWSSMFTGVWISVFFRLITFWRQILCVCVFFFFNTVAFIRSFQSLVILQNSSCIFKKWPLPLPKSYYNTISLLFTQTWLLCTFLQHCINHSVTIRVCDIVCHSLPGTISPVWLTSHHWCPAALIQCHCPEVIYWMSGLTQESAVTYCTPRFFHEWLSVSRLECFPISDALVVNCPYHSASFRHMGSDFFFF